MERQLAESKIRLETMRAMREQAMSRVEMERDQFRHGLEDDGRSVTSEYRDIALSSDFDFDSITNVFNSRARTHRPGSKHRRVTFSPPTILYTPQQIPAAEAFLPLPATPAQMGEAEVPEHVVGDIGHNFPGSPGEGTGEVDHQEGADASSEAASDGDADPEEEEGFVRSPTPEGFTYAQPRW